MISLMDFDVIDPHGVHPSKLLSDIHYWADGFLKLSFQRDWAPFIIFTNELQFVDRWLFDYDRTLATFARSFPNYQLWWTRNNNRSEEHIHPNTVLARSKQEAYQRSSSPSSVASSTSPSRLLVGGDAEWQQRREAHGAAAYVSEYVRERLRYLNTTDREIKHLYCDFSNSSDIECTWKAIIKALIEKLLCDLTISKAGMPVHSMQ
jgi:hypothetical protein